MVTVAEHLGKLMAQTDGAWYGGYVNMLKTLESAFPSPKHWILEFVQNAEDAGSSRIAIRLSEDSIWILNDGQPFNDENFRAVCDVNSRKMPSLGFRGYIGIGFKSIFRITDRIEIHSGGYHFAFDRSYWDNDKRKGVSITRWPWEILPLEVKPSEMPEGFTTGFFVPLPHTEGRDTEKELADFMEGTDFPKEMILLLKNIKTVEIQTPDASFKITKEIRESKHLNMPREVIQEKVTVKRQEWGVPISGESGYLVFRANVDVPSDIRKDRETERVRRSDVTRREMGLVFALDDEGNIRNLSGKLAGVYSFLPVEGEQTGLPFGIFGDFIPSIGRDFINYGVAWNRWMCREVAELVRLITLNVFAEDDNWKFYPAEMLQGITLNNSGLSGDFWNTELVRPVNEFLISGKLFPDSKGNVRKLDELIVLDQSIRDILDGSFIETILGKSEVDPALQDKLPASVERLDIYALLFKKPLLENIKKADTAKLIQIYRGLEPLNSYRIEGRGGRDAKLSQVPFVLAEDGQLYAPENVVVLQLELAKLPDFLRSIVGTDKLFLHADIASDEKSVKQLERCGLEVISQDSITRRTLELVNGVKSQEDCPESWKYPDDLVRAALLLISRDNKWIDKFVTDEGSLHSPKNTFSAGAPLDWSQLYRAGLLAPGYLPLSHKYFEFASEFDISIEKLNQSLDDMGVHGFHADEDETLIEHSAYTIAKNRLSKGGHKPEDVHDQTELGYDLKCQGHCSKIFEVKGMAQPRDIPLEESQVNAAEHGKEDYILVCVYNLPSAPDKVGYREIADPRTIWKAVEKARIPQKSWLMV